MHSTAGTGMSPADLRSFYREANFRLKVNGREGLYAPDYSHVQDLSDYLSANGTVIEGHTLAGFTPEQQELLAGWIADEIDAILPAEYRIPVTRGKDNGFPACRRRAWGAHACPRDRSGICRTDPRLDHSPHGIHRRVHY